MWVLVFQNYVLAAYNVMQGFFLRFCLEALSINIIHSWAGYILRVFCAPVCNHFFYVLLPPPIIYYSYPAGSWLWVGLAQTKIGGSNESSIQDKKHKRKQPLPQKTACKPTQKQQCTVAETFTYVHTCTHTYLWLAGI